MSSISSAVYAATPARSRRGERSSELVSHRLKRLNEPCHDCEIDGLGRVMLHACLTVSRSLEEESHRFVSTGSWKNMALHFCSSCSTVSVLQSSVRVPKATSPSQKSLRRFHSTANSQQSANHASAGRFSHNHPPAQHDEAMSGS
jgi:hypothetical protein